MTKDDITELKNQIIINSHVTKEYEGWINLLSNILNLKDDVKKHHDIGTPVDKGLNKLKFYENEIIEIKKKINQGKKNYHQKKINLREIRTISSVIENDILDNEIENITYQNDQLMITVNALTDELDKMCMENKLMNSKLTNSNELKLLKELESLKEENKILYEMISEENHINFRKSKDDSNCDFNK